MADKVDPRTGELTTANYGWIKPTVGASTDAWGGYINTDLDGIDSTVHSIQTSVPAASSTTPAMDGTAAVGTGTTWARADHVHPTDTSRYAATNPSGYQTAAQVTASLAPYAPLASPALTGVPTAPTAAPGTNTTQVATTAFVEALPVAMGDNRIINGNFATNQRVYVSGTALPANPTVANGYGHDRWKAGANGCTYTFTAALPDTTITITANTLTQIIEAGMIEGGVYTLSWTGTAQARVYQGTPTGSYAASPIVTASLTAGTNTIVEFNTGSVGRVKLEIGAVATPFNRQSLAKSLADCQRYYQLLSPYGQANFPAATALYAVGTQLPVTMRASPTIVFLSGNMTNLASTSHFFQGNNTVVSTGSVVTAGAQCAIAPNLSASAEV